MPGFCFRFSVLPVNLTDDNGQIGTMNVNVIITNDVLNIFGNKTKNIHVLFQGKLSDGKGVGHILDFRRQTFRGNAFNFQSVNV